MDEENTCRKCPVKVEEAKLVKEYRGMFYLATEDSVHTVKFFSNHFGGKHTELTDGKEIAEKIGAEVKDKQVVVDADGELEEGSEMAAVRIVCSG